MELEQVFYSEPELPDERVTWRDTGCDLHPHCLSCPELVCVLELRGGKATRRSAARVSRILALAASGSTPAEIAGLLGVNVRTVQRALSR